MFSLSLVPSLPSPRYQVFPGIAETLPRDVDFAIAHYRPALDRRIQSAAGQLGAVIARMEQHLARDRECHNPQVADEFAASMATSAGEQAKGGHKGRDSDSDTG